MPYSQRPLIQYILTLPPTPLTQEFLDRLSSGDVSYVEFLAPNGDRAYAQVGEKRIRIGEGYPVEQSKGWSSPAFAIRSVKDKGVPYRFVVPELEKYR